jgi:hypothetical protein
MQGGDRRYGDCRQRAVDGLADQTKLEISICHLPPGTSKWNKIEHRLFSFIRQNWRGKPLVSYQVIVNLIAATTTRTGLRVRAEIDPGKYPKGVKVLGRRGGLDSNRTRQVSWRVELQHSSAPFLNVATYSVRDP